MNRLVFGFVGLSLLLPSAAWASRARAPESRPPAASRPAIAPDVLPLSRLMSYPGPIRLERSHSEASVPLPISQRMTLRGAKLRLQWVNSAALLPGRSQLIVMLNDQVVTQLPLDGSKPRASREIPLPLEMLKPGFNQLRLQAIQHYTAGWEDPLAPELWTQLDPQRSAVLLDEERHALTPQLADLDELFSPKEPGERRITLLSASEALLDEKALKAGSLIAQGLALRLQYVPLSVDAAVPASRPKPLPSATLPGFDPRCLAGGDGVLFGTADQLMRFVGEGIGYRIRGPFLGVYPVDGDARHVVLVVSGRNEDELQKAATALAFSDSPYPKAPEAIVQSVAPPSADDDAAYQGVSPGRRYEFSALGFRTQTYNGFQREEANLSLSLPADLYARPTDSVALRLHFATGEGLQKGSVVNVLVNRRFAAAIPLETMRAQLVEDYPIRLPMRFFRAGENSLTFSTQFLPEVGRDTRQHVPEGLLMTLFEDSSLEFPALHRFVEMPNLELLALRGFPYTQKPDGAETRLWLGASDPETLSAAWTLMGRLAQTTRLPLFRAAASYAPKAPTENLLVVSARSVLPAALERPSASGLAVGPAPLLGFISGKGSPVGPEVRFELAPESNTRLTAAQFQSPFRRDRSVTLWTADSPQALKAGMRSLVQTGAWSGMHGGSSFWEPEDAKMAWKTPERGYTVGWLPPTPATTRLGSKYPLALAGLVVGLGALLALSLTVLLKRRLRKEHRSNVQENLF